MPVATTAAGKGSFRRDPSAGAGRVRHVRHRGGECLRRRGRSGPRRRLETSARATPPGRTEAARPDAAELSCRSTSSRATPRGTSRPSTSCSAMRRRSSAQLCEAVRLARATAGARRRRGASRGTARRTAISTRRAYFADDKPILPQRVIGELHAQPAGGRDRHLRRRREPHPDDAFLPDQGGRAGFCRRPAPGRWGSASRRRSAPSSCIPTGRSSRCAATAGSR